jgi:hypothetical protein
MLTFILIGGLVWLVAALVFVLAIAAAARKQVSPIGVSVSEESIEQEVSHLVASKNSSVPEQHSLPLQEPIAT